MSTTDDVQLDEKVKLEIIEPKKWKVIFLNDNHTPMEFVVTVLVEIYKHTIEVANELTMQIHDTGSGVAGTYTFEIAEIKAVETTTLARAQGFPLQIKLEEE
jgi:ATP-dependent Clp protease adaptor protein ClpS